MTFDAERVFCPAIIVPEGARITFRNLRRFANRRGPRVKAGGFGPDGDVGVYQRGSAQTAAAYYHNGGVDIHLVKPEWI